MLSVFEALTRGVKNKGEDAWRRRAAEAGLRAPWVKRAEETPGHVSSVDPTVSAGRSREGAQLKGEAELPRSAISAGHVKQM